MWIEIFRTGNQTDAAGNTKNYTQNDLDQIVIKYNDLAKLSNSYEAPIVLGHPENDEPAYGWVNQLERRGDLLYAELKELSPDFAGLIEKKLYKKVSIALYKDLTLKHIGLLGAVPPAVKGLVNVNFNNNNMEDFIYYSQAIERGKIDMSEIDSCEMAFESNQKGNLKIANELMSQTSTKSSTHTSNYSEVEVYEKDELLNKIAYLEGELNKFKNNKLKTDFKHKMENKFISEYNISLNKNERDLLYDSIDNLLNDIDFRFENNTTQNYTSENDKSNHEKFYQDKSNQFSESLFNSISNILMVYNQSIKSQINNNKNKKNNSNNWADSLTNEFTNDFTNDLNYSISDNIESKNSNTYNFNEFDFPNFDHKYLGKNTNIQAKKLALHNKIIELAKAQNVSYEEAISLL